MEKKDGIRINNVEVRIAIGVSICLFICHFVPAVPAFSIGGMPFSLQALAAATAVIMCTQDIDKTTWKSGLTRLLGVICGGVSAIIVVLIDGLIGNDCIFYILCGLGLLLNVLFCKLVKMPPIPMRVSMISFCLVALLMSDYARVMYAINRFVGTLLGAVVALIIAAIWTRMIRGKE